MNHIFELLCYSLIIQYCQIGLTKSNLTTDWPINSFKKFHAIKRQIGYLVSHHLADFVHWLNNFRVPWAILDVKKITLLTKGNCFISCFYSVLWKATVVKKANVTFQKSYFITLSINQTGLSPCLKTRVKKKEYNLKLGGIDSLNFTEDRK